MVGLWFGIEAMSILLLLPRGCIRLDRVWTIWKMLIPHLYSSIARIFLRFKLPTIVGPLHVTKCQGDFQAMMTEQLSWIVLRG